MDTLLYAAALVCFIIACILGAVAATGKAAGFNWIALGLAFWVITNLTP